LDKSLIVSMSSKRLSIASSSDITTKEIDDKLGKKLWSWLDSFHRDIYIYKYLGCRCWRLL
jgi:hypothetical protein